MYKFLSVAFFTALTVPALAQKPAPCKLTVKKTDTQTISITPATEPAMLGKVVTPSDTSYFLRLRTDARTLVADAKGVKVLLGGGRVLEKADVDVKPTGDKTASGALIYEAMIPLERVEVVWLTIYPIAGYELYVFSGALTDPEAARLRKYAECIF